MTSSSPEPQITSRYRRRRAELTDNVAQRTRVNQLARGVLLWVLIAFLGTALFLHFLNVRFPSLLHTEAIDNAQIAVNYLKTGKLTTRVVYPLAIGLPRPDIEGYDIYRAPLYPLVLSLLLRTRGADDATVAMANGLFHLLTGWVLFCIINLVYNRRAALWGTLAFFVSTDALTIPLQGQGPSLTGLLYTLTVFLSLKATVCGLDEDARPYSLTERIATSPWFWATGAAITGGLMWLSGYTAVLMFMPIGALAASRFRNPRAGFIVLVVIGLLTVSPWFARNYRLLHHVLSPMSQYELVMHTPQFLARSVLWTTTERPDHPWIWALMHPGQMFYKLIQGLTVVYGALPFRTNPYLFALAFVGLIATGKTPLQGRLWRVLVWCIVLQGITLSLYDIDAAPMSIFAALFSGLGVVTLMQLLSEHVESISVRRSIQAGFIALMMFPYVTSVWMGGRTAEDDSMRSIAILATNLPQNAVVASDLAWQVAWYAERRAVLLPGDPAQMAAISSRGYTPDFLYLSRRMRGPAIEKGRGYWYGVMHGKVDVKPLGQPFAFPNDELVISTPHAATLNQQQTGKQQPGK